MPICSTYRVIPVDIALEYSATIEALIITSMSVGYFLNPIIMEYMVSNHVSIFEHNITYLWIGFIF